ncbi:MAG: AI-2E family transporter [Patescibacteria group bacterium]
MDKEDNKLTIDITTGTIVKIVISLFLVFAIFELKGLILIILTAIVIASSIELGSKRLVKMKIPRVLAVLAIYIGFFLVLFIFLSFLLPSLFGELVDLAHNLPERIQSMDQVNLSLDPLSSITGGLASSFSVKGLILQVLKFITQASDNIFRTASAIFGGVFSSILILVISFYLSVQERGIENFLRVVVPLKNEKYAIDLWLRSQEKIGRWFQGQVLLGVIVGLLVFLGLSILQIKYALTLGILTALFEIIPFFGPILSAVPAVLLGFGEGIPTGLMVLGLYIIVQQFENNLIYPLVVKKILGVPPLIVILALLVGGTLAGFLGLIISVPLATVLMELANDIEKRKLIFKNNNSA